MNDELLTRLVLGGYGFTAAVTVAGARAFHYLYKLITNHQAHRFEALEKRMDDLEKERRPDGR